MDGIWWHRKYELISFSFSQVFSSFFVNIENQINYVKSKYDHNKYAYVWHPLDGPLINSRK